MLKIFEPTNVLYVCICGAEKPITKIYFCRHCLKIRCSECVSHEVDSHYCQNCLEYMTSPEARVKLNKCSNCFNCPSCMHTLSTRATTVQVPNPDEPDKTMPKKVYYLICGFCRWTSRDVGIPDQTTASGGWQETENPQCHRINQLMEHYRLLAQKEKMEKEKKKISQRCSLLHISDKYGMSATVTRKLAGMRHSFSSQNKKELETPQLKLPEASSTVESLPEHYLTEPLNLLAVCTLKQSLFQPQFQPILTTQLYPQNKYLHIKRSQRCKECDRNLSKPEYNPSSIKFKIQLAAFYHIPELRIKQVSKLYLEKVCQVEMVLINPSPHLAHINFVDIEPSDKYSKVKVPPCELILAGKDDAAEFDDINDTQNFQDDPNVVTFRKSNKLGFMFSVVPSTKDVYVSFIMKHDFINMVVTLPGEAPREPQEILLTHQIIVHLGRVIGET